MQVATFNINGVNARLPVVKEWLGQAQPDIVGLQEIKCLDESFPASDFEALGYNVATHGQKGFNGVALLSKKPLDEVHRGLPGAPEDEQARLIEGTVSTATGSVRVCNIYLPNGNPVESEKFAYKLTWMERLEDFVRTRLVHEEPFLLIGDFNLIPSGADCHDAKAWWGDALFRPESLARYRRLVNLGLTDCLRASTGAPAFTFWDFQAGAWRRDAGIRIDHLLASPQAADALEDVVVHKDVRGWEKPSDHVPVMGQFALEAA